MHTVPRSEIVDYQTWTDQRDNRLEAVLAIKRTRRVHVGPHLTFLFENRDTIRWQVQEMMRVERIVRERDIQHELNTYNELLGDQGDLGCTLLIEIDDPADRDVKLTAWLDMPQHLYVELADGSRVSAIFDERQVGDRRVSSVQYLRFPVQGRAPVAVGCSLPAHTQHHVLTEEQQAALTQDLTA